ncbi:amidohydrolase family protein [Nocardia brasiliensis]|uniref:amidohydrolase family protein n=1 Tax=Nocardia brasiliensis TaxID=37326 RepID=UPI0032B01D50
MGLGGGGRPPAPWGWAASPPPAARGPGREGTAGRVAIGCTADLTVFSLDPLVVPPDELAGAPIAATVVDGAVVHRAEFA